METRNHDKTHTQSDSMPIYKKTNKHGKISLIYNCDLDHNKNRTTSNNNHHNDKMMAPCLCIHVNCSQYKRISQIGAAPVNDGDISSVTTLFS